MLHRRLHLSSFPALLCGLLSIVIPLFVLSEPAHAATGGSISGVVADQSGAVIPQASLTLTETSQETTYHAVSNEQGNYTFPSLPVGHYDLSVKANRFATQHRMNLAVDADSALRVDVVLSLDPRTDTVSVVSNSAVEVDAIATHLGEAISSTQMNALPLNGRNYTDLLAIQPGVAPVSTLLPSSVIMAGVTGSLDPSGDLNTGNLSINGQRESSNGFMVNGIDVQEHMNGGTSVILNLDSIQEFRVLTSNFDLEYGNYNGGMLTVVSKSGSNAFHGDVFEFFRNTALDARGYFDPTRPAFQQNQFGGTLGGPMRREKVFFFGDYQATRTSEGISTGNISVPTVAERSGTFNDLTGSVSGPYLASLLTQSLGYTVQAGEPYTQVFPGGAIPRRAWSAPGGICCSTFPRLTSERASMPRPPLPKRFATTRVRFTLTRTAVVWESCQRIILSTTIASTIHIRAPLPGRAFPASTRYSSAARNSFLWETPRPLAQEPSMNCVSATCATQISSDTQRGVSV